MKDILVCNGSAQTCLDFFLEHKNELGKIVKLTSFFDNENFLLTKYNVANREIHTIIEDENGNEMQLAGLNCGYGGTGPTRNSEIAVDLGVDQQEAHENRGYRGIQYTFTETGYSFSSISPFFTQKNTSRTNEPFMMDENIKVDIVQRKVYMINPQNGSYASLLSCLYSMEPVELEYYVGKESAFESDRNLHEVFGYNASGITAETHNLSGVNLLIRGNLFDVCCYINCDELFSVLNSVHSAIFSRPLLNEAYLGDCVLMYHKRKKAHGFLMFLKWLFNREKYSEYYGRIAIPKGGMRL